MASAPASAPGAWSGPGSSRSARRPPATAASLSAAAAPAVTEPAPSRLTSGMDIAGMPLAILVNPSSAGGRALRLLPRVEQYLDARRVAFRVARTRSLEHGAEQA